MKESVQVNGIRRVLVIDGLIGHELVDEENVTGETSSGAFCQGSSRRGQQLVPKVFQQAFTSPTWPEKRGLELFDADQSL